jgi:hypothetical protein
MSEDYVECAGEPIKPMGPPKTILELNLGPAGVLEVVPPSGAEAEDRAIPFDQPAHIQRAFDQGDS